MEQKVLKESMGAEVIYHKVLHRQCTYPGSISDTPIPCREFYRGVSGQDSINMFAFTACAFMLINGNA